MAAAISATPREEEEEQGAAAEAPEGDKAEALAS